MIRKNDELFVKFYVFILYAHIASWYYNDVGLSISDYKLTGQATYITSYDLNGAVFMIDPKKKMQTKKVDTKEFELPETLFVRDVENKVFQGIVLQCLSRIDGIALVEGNFIDNILGRTALEGVKGIVIEQDNKNHSVGIRIDVNICYGHSIPEKAEEIQTACAEEITKLTGLHVSSVHVVFKNVVLSEQLKKSFLSDSTLAVPPVLLGSNIEEEYNDEF